MHSKNKQNKAIKNDSFWIGLSECSWIFNTLMDKDSPVHRDTKLRGNNRVPKEFNVVDMVLWSLFSKLENKQNVYLFKASQRTHKYTVHTRDLRRYQQPSSQSSKTSDCRHLGPYGNPLNWKQTLAVLFLRCPNGIIRDKWQQESLGE